MSKGTTEPATLAEWYCAEGGKAIADALAGCADLTYGWTEEFLADWNAK